MKITCWSSKKVPIPGVSYSSLEFGAEMSMDLPEGVDQAQAQRSFDDMYLVLLHNIDLQLVRQGAMPAINTN